MLHNTLRSSLALNAQNSTLEDASQINSPDIQGRPSLVERRKEFREKLIDRQSQNDIDIEAVCLFLAQIYRVMDQDYRIREAQDMAQMFRYYDGNCYGEYDENGTYVEYEPRPGDFAYSIPLLFAHVQTALTLMLKTNPEFEYKAVDNDSTEDSALAEMCKDLAEELWKNAWTEEKRQLELTYKLLTGKSFRRLDYAVNGENPKYTSSPDVSVEENAENSGAAKVKTKLKGKKRVPKPEIILHIPNPMSVQIKTGSRSVASSPFVIERDRLSRKTAEYLYKIEIPLSSRIQMSPEQLTLQELERSTVQSDSTLVSLTGLAKGLMYDDVAEVEREIFWLSPSEYANYYLTVESVLPDGKTRLPANCFMGDAAQEGLFFVVVADVVVDVKIGENKIENWEELKMGIRPATNSGTGLKHLRTLVDIVNGCFNLKIACAIRDARPTTIIDGRYITSLPQAGEIMIADDMPAGTGVQQLMYRDQGASTHPVVDSLTQGAESWMQFVGGTFSLGAGAGAPDAAAAGTATGIAAMQDMMVGRMMSAIKLRNDADINTRYKLLNLRKKHINTELRKKYIERFGVDRFKAFMSKDISEVVSISIKKGTDQPESTALMVSYMTTLTQAMASVKDQPFGPEILQFMAKQMNFPISITPGANDRRQAEYRINLMKQAEKTLAMQNPAYLLDVAVSMQQITNQILTLTESALEQADAFAPILFFEHDTFIDAYGDWLMSESGLAASEVLRAAVADQRQLHYERKIMKQALEATLGAQLEAEIQGKIAKMMADRAAQDAAQSQLGMVTEAENAKKEELMTEGLRMEAEDVKAERDLNRTLRGETEKSKLRLVEMKAQKQLEPPQPRPSKESGGKQAPK